MANRTNHKPNSGSFQKGHDPRRMNPQTFKNGQRVRELCRLQTEAAVATLAEIMRDTEEKGSNRISAANALLNRGWGNPVSAVAILEDTPDAKQMSRAELDAAIAHALGVEGDTIEGEAIQEPVAALEADPVGRPSEGENVA